MSALLKPLVRGAIVAAVGVLIMASIFSRTSRGDSANARPAPAPRSDAAPATQPGQTQSAVFAGGCFWCVEAVFEQLDGVKEAISGYAGGDAKSANYKAVCTGATGHAEAVRIVYDPAKITFGRLLQVFFSTHDPTTKDRQGPDTGTQYRSAIFYADDEQKRLAEEYIRQLQEAKTFAKPIVTTLEPLKEFFTAEQYHQDYARRNPGQSYIAQYAIPKAQKTCKLFPELVKPATKPAK